MRVQFRAAARRRQISSAVAAILLLIPAGSALSAVAAPDDPSGSGEVKVAPTVWRIAGGDRFEVAVQISLRTNPVHADIVYVASGATFADALSAGPAAARSRASLLLVPTGPAPAVVLGEIARLDPLQVIVIGGPASIPDSTMIQIQGVVPRASLTRIAGADRYDVSRNVSAFGFPAADGAMIATGRDFPDALSAGALAASYRMPLVLVDGSAPSVEPLTIELLRRYLGRGYLLVGGPSSISAGVEASISSLIPPLRIGGADRYQVSIALNERLALNFSTVYLATGASFPDALAGGVLAGRDGVPLYVVPQTCVPKAILAAMSTRGTTKVILLGGPASLSDAVAALTPCTW